MTDSNPATLFVRFAFRRGQVGHEGNDDTKLIGEASHLLHDLLKRTFFVSSVGHSSEVVEVDQLDTFSHSHEPDLALDYIPLGLTK